MRIAVISDVHGACKPFEAALSDAHREGFDQLILLGDLMTYGIEPNECLELAREATCRHGAILIGGNHDQLYVDLAQGRSAYIDGLPDWIQESVFWTMDRTGGWPPDIAWAEQHVAEDALFAHANPFGYGDWTYLAGDAQLDQATERLFAQGFKWGIFGHLHRTMIHSSSGVTAYVVGSIGQPRSQQHPLPQWSMVTIEQGSLCVEPRTVDFDADAHCTAIQRTTALSQATRDQLCRYFK